jgi:hypothetical protein
MFKRALFIFMVTTIFIVCVLSCNVAECGLPAISFSSKGILHYSVEKSLLLPKRLFFRSDYVFFKDAREFKIDGNGIAGLSGIFEWIRDKAYDLFINQGIQEKGSLSDYLFESLLKSILLLLLALLIWWVGHLGFRALSKHTDFLRKECEGFEARICSYFNIVKKLFHAAIIIKARIKTKPIKQWMVGREMNKRIKKRFDQEGVEIPFPHRTVYFGEASKSFDIHLEENKDNEIIVKKWIRDILAEETQGKNQANDL